jgi:tetratricopeptide (TPR) repeat protein
MAFAAFLSALLAAPEAEPPPRPAIQAPPIVVTGKRIEDSEKRLSACLERRCPPDEDIAATLAHAETLFVAGDYARARRTLRRSLGRNRRHAARFPEPVSDLYRASALAANHLGFEEEHARSTWGILSALKEGIPRQDARHFGARMEIAAMTARLRGFAAAEDVYESLARDAGRGGRPDIAAIARLRAAGLYWQRRPTASARRRLQDIASSTAPETRVAARMAKLYLARIARQSGRTAEAEALIREVAGPGFAQPVLVHSPPYELTVQELEVDVDKSPNEAQGNPARRYGGYFDKTWIDVGFWVQPTGKVSDLEILRKSGDSTWAAPLLKSIAGRLYAAAPDPAYRIERYTYTSGYEIQTGSHIRQRSPRARVEYFDLTPDEGGALR